MGVAHVADNGSEDDSEEFSNPLPPDMVEVRVNEDSVEVELGSGIKDEGAVSEAYADVLCNYFCRHFAQKLLGEEGLTAVVNMSPQGKPDDDGDDDPNSGC